MGKMCCLFRWVPLLKPCCFLIEGLDVVLHKGAAGAASKVYATLKRTVTGTFRKKSTKVIDISALETGQEAVDMEQTKKGDQPPTGQEAIDIKQTKQGDQPPEPPAT